MNWALHSVGCMDELRAVSEDEAAQMPSWIFTFWRSMCNEGRKEETAKNYARTFAMLFRENQKAPSEMASQTYFELVKASPKNKSGNGQRSASVAAFQKFYNAIQGDVSKLDEPDEDAKFCQVSGEQRPRPGRKPKPPEEAQANGATKAEAKAPSAKAEAKAARVKKAEKAEDEVKGRKAKPKENKEREKIKVNSEEGFQRKTVPLKRAFELLAGPNSEAPSVRPRAVHVHGRDINKRMAQRIHGLYTEIQDEVKGGKPVFEKADHEKKTYILFNEEKKTWRMSVSMEEQGDFAKVKEPVDLPWMVTKAWKVFSESNAYEEDPDLKCDYLDPKMPLPEAEVEVCLQMSENGAASPPGELATGTSSSSKRKDRAEPTRTGERALRILGLDDSIKNAQRIMGTYDQQGEHNGRPIFVKDDKAKPSVLFFHTEKDKWRIAKSVSERGDFAHVKDQAELPWQVGRAWKVFDGETYREVSMTVEVLVQAPKAEDEKKRPPPPSLDFGLPKLPKPDVDEIGLDLLARLPQDAPEGHAAHHAVNWEGQRLRAFFYFNGTRFDVPKSRARSQSSAMIIGRACYVKLLSGWSIDQALTFRDMTFQQIRENPDAGDTDDEEDSIESDEKPTPRRPSKKARLASSNSSLSSSSDTDEESSREASKAAPKAEVAGCVGFLQKGTPNHRVGRVSAKMSARSGLRCFRCFQERNSCRCKDRKA